MNRLLARMEDIEITFEDVCACRERDLFTDKRSRSFAKVTSKNRKELGAAVRKVTIDIAKQTIQVLLDNYIPRGNDRVVIPGQVDKDDAVLDCVNKGIMEAAIALR